MSAQTIWRQVLLLAVMDARNGLPTDASSWKAGTRQDARDYILTPNPDFHMVCHLAGLDPEAVRDSFRRLQDTGSNADCASRSLPVARGPIGRKYSYQGHNLTLREWAEWTGLPYDLLRKRLTCRGWPLERALTEPMGQRRLSPAEPDLAAGILEQLPTSRLPLTAGVDAAHQRTHLAP
jgi:hypothetical protein